MASIETNARHGGINPFDVAAGKLIEKGNPVFIKEATGFAFQPKASDVAAAGDKFVGYCVETIDNTGGTDAALWVRVQSYGVHQVPATGFAQSAVGDLVKVAANGTYAAGSTAYFTGVIVARTASIIDVHIDQAFGQAYA